MSVPSTVLATIDRSAPCGMQVHVLQDEDGFGFASGAFCGSRGASGVGLRSVPCLSLGWLSS